MKGSIQELGRTKASVTKPRGVIKDYVWRVEYVLDKDWWLNMIECTNEHAKDDPEWTNYQLDKVSIAKFKGWYAIHWYRKLRRYTIAEIWSKEDCVGCQEMAILMTRREFELIAKHRRVTKEADLPASSTTEG